MFKKSLFGFSLLILSLALLTSCKKNSTETQQIVYPDYVAFDWFNYEGKDAIYDSLQKTDNEYYNPIISGFYPDPSICRVGDDFYMVNSSFSYFPGIPIFKSTDLVKWKQIGHVLNRTEQVDFTGAGVSRGIFAPTIRYNNGVFYVISTWVDKGGNFIVTTKNPEGPWSNPVFLPEVDGIDPDIFFDDDGKVYITHNGPPPNNITMHNGHRAIYTMEYDLETQKIISEPKLIVNGGTDMAKKPVWIEAPHILKKDGYYYLICAEGGTAYNHSEVVFRSKNVYGPYLSYENNPIMTQRTLDKNRKNQITTTGHSDFVQLPNGDWWSVYLGCRPYGDELYNTGRETFMLPLTWENGWPIIENGNEPHPFKHQKPNLPKTNEEIPPMAGNFISHDDFSSDTLDFKWSFIRNPLEKWHELDGEQLYIKPRNESIHTETNFSFIGRRQQHLEFEVSTKLSYNLTDTIQTAGLVAFQNEKNYLLIGKRLNEEGKTEVYLEKTATKIEDGKSIILAKNELISNTNDLFVKIDGKMRYSDFYYKTSENEDWKLLIENVDAVNLSTKEAGGFVGTFLAMYTSLKHFE